MQSVGADVTVTCTVELGPSVVESDLSVLMVDAQLSRNGTPLTLTAPTVAGTTFTYTIQLNHLGGLSLETIPAQLQSAHHLHSSLVADLSQKQPESLLVSKVCY